MKCPYCGRHVRLFSPRRSSLLKKVLPRCHACRRYVLTRAHKLVLASLALAAFLMLLKYMGIL